MRCETCGDELRAGDRYCRRCGTLVRAVVATAPVAAASPGKLSIQQRIRARMLASSDEMTEGPVSAGQWAADLLKLLAFVAGLGLLFIFLVSGLEFLRGLSITLFGYRLTGTANTVLTYAFFVPAIPICFVLAMVAMVMTFWTYRSWHWFVPHLVVSVLPVAELVFFILKAALAPYLATQQHINNWPAELELAGFEVCAIQLNESASRTTAPAGRIAFDIVNRSTASLADATFSVKGGSNWYRFTVQNLEPAGRRHVERVADLGAIEVELSGDFTGRAKRSGELYWDTARFATAVPLRLGRRPNNADVAPIRRCP